MPRQPRGDVPPALVALTGGDDQAAALMDEVYGELRALAGGYFREQQGPITLQPTALVHEAFLKVANRTGLRFRDRHEFVAICAGAMRGILAEHPRRRRAAKRGGVGRDRVSLTEIATPGGDAIDAIALDEALTALASLNERQARIVEYRFFGGMTVEDVAQVLDVSRSTVEDDWRMARAWLKVKLSNGPPP
jgi:RNA polymerase sigma-70 factor (ECF subfamily)